MERDDEEAILNKGQQPNQGRMLFKMQNRMVMQEEEAVAAKVFKFTHEKKQLT